MARSSARIIGTATITVLLRGWLLLVVWGFTTLLLASRVLLLTLGGAIIILSTLAFFFWGLVGLVTGSLHTLLLAISSIPAAIVGVGITGLGDGSLLRAVQHRVAVMRAEDAAHQAATRPPEPVRLLPRPQTPPN